VVTPERPRSDPDISPEYQQAVVTAYDGADSGERRRLLAREGVSAQRVRSWRQRMNGDSDEPRSRPLRSGTRSDSDVSGAEADPLQRLARGAGGRLRRAPRQAVEPASTGTPEREGTAPDRPPATGTRSSERSRPGRPGGQEAFVDARLVATGVLEHAATLLRLLDLPRDASTADREAFGRLTDCVVRGTEAATGLLAGGDARHRPAQTVRPAQVRDQLVAILGELTGYPAVAAAAQVLAYELAAVDLHVQQATSSGRGTGAGRVRRGPWWGSEPARSAAGRTRR
jgi:hypothetical protein